MFEATERSLPFFNAKFSEKSLTFLETPGVGNTSQRITLTNGLNNPHVYQFLEDSQMQVMAVVRLSN